MFSNSIPFFCQHKIFPSYFCFSIFFLRAYTTTQNFHLLLTFHFCSPIWYTSILNHIFHVFRKIWLFVLFIAVWAIFQLSSSCHHYRWQGCKFRPMLSTHGFWQWGFFFMPHLLRNGTSVYIVSSEGPAPTSHSGIRTRGARITRFPHLRSM
jgi:hypothetical protein